MTTTPTGCPVHPRVLPTDGTSLEPSPVLAAWREESPVTPLHYTDGHDGWIVTRHELARLVLEDPRFSQQPQRIPGETIPGGPELPYLDDEALASKRIANLLFLDGEAHSRVRRILMARFSVRAGRALQPEIAAIVARQVAHLLTVGAPADLMGEFAAPISTAVHRLVLGIPDARADEFARLFLAEAPVQARVLFARAVIEQKRSDLGDDVLSDLIRSDLSTGEVDWVALVLMISGRDAAAYMIATSLLALLRHPDQLAALRDDPQLMGGAVEEFMRYGTMFVALFPRTATEDVQIGGTRFAVGESVSVSPVAANRDADRFENPDGFDITRDAFGHLGFGHGIHGCLGQQVARVEIREAVGQLIAAFPALRLVSAEQLAPLPFAHPVATYSAGSLIVEWS